MEVLANTYKTNTQTKTKTIYSEPSSPLFIKPTALKFKDLVDFKTMQKKIADQ